MLEEGRARVPPDLLPSLLSQTSRQSHDSEPLGSTTSENDSPHSSTIDRLSSPEQVASTLSEPREGSWLQKLEPQLFSLYRKGSEKIKGEWEELEQAPRGTWKFRVATVGSKLMDQIPPSETFLKNAGAHAAAVKRAQAHGATLSEEEHKCTAVEKCALIYPSCIPKGEVEVALRHMLDINAAYHKRWLLLNVLCLPFSSAMAILPGPNVFVVWNGFRVYSHLQARKGALYLSDLISRHHTEDLITFVPSDQLSTIASEDWSDLSEEDDDGNRSDNEEEFPSDLDTWVQEDAPISDRIVRRICKLFGTPDLQKHVARLRDMALHMKTTAKKGGRSS